MEKQIASYPLVKEVMIDAPVELVWQAITSKEKLKQWCFDMDVFRPEAGFEFSFYGEKDCEKFQHLCKVVEVDPEKKMTWLWTYADQPGDTFVTFELQPVGEKTKLSLTHSGLENLPQNVHYAMENFEAGWSELLGKSLPGYLQREQLL